MLFCTRDIALPSRKSDRLAGSGTTFGLWAGLLKPLDLRHIGYRILAVLPAYKAFGRSFILVMLGCNMAQHWRQLYIHPGEMSDLVTASGEFY